MPLCRDIVNGALRKLGKLGAGREPRAADQNDAMEALRNLYKAFIAQGAFGRLRDVSPLADYTAGENERVFRTSSIDDEIEITLPELVRDEFFGSPFDYGSRWVPPSMAQSADLRPPRDCAVVIISDAYSGVNQSYIYDGTDRRWRLLDSLTLDDPAPLSTRDADGLKARLAMQIADEFGGDVSNATLALARSFQSSLVSRWSMPRREQMGVYC